MVTPAHPSSFNEHVSAQVEVSTRISLLEICLCFLAADLLVAKYPQMNSKTTRLEKKGIIQFTLCQTVSYVS